MHARRLAAALALLALVLGALWWLARAPERPLPEPLAPAPAPASAPTSANAALSDTEPAPSERAPELVREEQREAGAGSARAPAPTGEALVWRVRVIDRATRAAVPGAQLYWLDLGSQRARESAARRAELADNELALREFGDPARADAEGVLAIPWKRGAQGLVCARVDERYDERRFGLGEPAESVLALARDRSLAVRVLDERDAPVAAIPLSIRRGDASSGPVRTLHSGWRQATSGADGIAHFPHLQADPLEAALRAWVLFDLPMPAECFAEFALEDPPQSLDLRLPSCGALELRVSAAAGLGPLPKVRVSARALSGAAQTRGSGSAVAQDGLVRFARVATGGEYEVRATANGFEPVQLQVRGPAAAGDIARAELVFTRALPRLCGRALDEQQQPLASVALVAQLRLARAVAGGQASSARRRELTTDADGRFCVDFESESWSSLELVLERAEQGLSSEPRALALPLDAASAELGDCVLAPTPLIAAGRVLDSAGRGIAGAQVALYRQVGERSWSGTNQFARCDAEGRFELRGARPSTACGLGAQASGYSPRMATPLEPGARDLELVLQPEYGLVIEVVGAPQGFVPSVDARGWARSLTAPPGAPLATFGLGAGERVSFSEAGRVEVGLWIPTCCGQLPALAEVELAAGPPPVVKLDLSGRLYRVALAIGSELGRPLTEGSVRALGCPDPPIEFAGTPALNAAPEARIQLGRAQLWSLAPGIEVEAFAPWHRKLRQSVRDGDRLVLAAGIPIELQLPPQALALSAAGLRWSAEVECGGETVKSLNFGEDGRLALRVPAAGACTVRWSAVRAQPGAPDKSCTALAARSYDVRDQRDPQRFTLAIELERVRRELGL